MAGKCGVNVHTNVHQISARIRKAWRDTTPEVSQVILDDCNRYCKEDTGALIKSSYQHSDLKKGIIRWRTPYAKRQYWLKTAYRDKNPHARWKWADYAKSRYRKAWARMVEQSMKAKVKGG